MANVAYTQILHGKDDGTQIVIEEGKEVSGLPTDVVKALKEQGLIGPPRDAETAAAVNDELAAVNDERAAENAALREQIAALKAQLNQNTDPAKTGSAPATTKGADK